MSLNVTAFAPDLRNVYDERLREIQDNMSETEKKRLAWEKYSDRFFEEKGPKAYEDDPLIEQVLAATKQLKEINHRLKVIERKLNIQRAPGVFDY